MGVFWFYLGAPHRHFRETGLDAFDWTQDGNLCIIYHGLYKRLKGCWRWARSGLIQVFPLILPLPAFYFTFALGPSTNCIAIRAASRPALTSCKPFNGFPWLDLKY